MLDILIGALVFAAGFVTCYFTVKKPEQKNKSNYVVTEVKRIKPSFKNPLKTVEVNYEQYRSRENGAYQPVKPRRKSAVNEVDTDG